MAKPKQGGRAKAKRHVDAEGIAFIQATFNNTIITITDMAGNAVVWGSAGRPASRAPRSRTPFAATVAAEQAAKEALRWG
jgi:small subunit ribosomal protein S11